MPPKNNSKPKSTMKKQVGNYSFNPQQQNNKNGVNRGIITFLLIGLDKVGIDVPYHVMNSHQVLKAIIKSENGEWQRDERIWVVQLNKYNQIFDKMLAQCKDKDIRCDKIPEFVYAAAITMPTELTVKLYRSLQTITIKYLEIEKGLDPEVVPFYDKLYDFQKQSLQFGIEHHGRLLLADEMGVGKTIQSLAIAYIYKYEWPLLVICPSTLRFNWQNQVLQWYGNHIKKSEVQVYTKGGSTLKESTKVLIISFELAWKFKELLTDFKIVIVDQAHYLKNSGCKRTDILVPLLAKKKRVILLTGTPAFARPKQIFNLALIIRPDAFNNFNDFGNRYCEPTRNPWSGAYEYNGCRNTKQLFFLLKDKVMLRRLKKEVLTQLPDKQRQKIAIQTNKSITREINALINNSENQTKKPEDLIMEMLAFKGTNEPEENRRSRESIMEAYRLTGLAKVEGVIQYILSLLENDVKLLIFAHHKTILTRIQEALEKNKYKFIRIDGDVEISERQDLVNSFQSNKQIMAALLSISAAGVGLTLTASSTVVFAELHWTPGMMIQAEDRAHRIGQKNCVNCHYLIGEGSLDNLLYNYLLRKINNVSTFIDGTEKRLEMQEIAKGELGKVSKKCLEESEKKQRFSSFGKIKQIRQQKITIDFDEPDKYSSCTDISSDIQANGFNFQADYEAGYQTESICSNRKRTNCDLNEENEEQEGFRIKNKMQLNMSRLTEQSDHENDEVLISRRNTGKNGSLQSSEIIDRLISSKKKEETPDKTANLKTDGEGPLELSP